MPFLPHFGLDAYPFGLTPNARLFYPTEQAKALLAGLEFALMRGDGLLKVVGEVGTGKTMVARLLVERLSALPCNTAYLNMPMMESTDIPIYVAQEFGVKITKNTDPVRALRKFLTDQHSKGFRNVLIVDESQTLGAEGLEAVRLLSNMETETDKLLQIVLFGQKELDDLLHLSELRQVAQRIQFSFMTLPMPSDVAADYVRFRVERCLNAEANRGVFTPRALILLARASHGVPRILHLLADKALIAAYADGKSKVMPSHVRLAVRETPDVKMVWWGWLF